MCGMTSAVLRMSQSHPRLLARYTMPTNAADWQTLSMWMLFMCSRLVAYTAVRPVDQTWNDHVRMHLGNAYIVTINCL